jgi:hypothetical protein
MNGTFQGKRMAPQPGQGNLYSGGGAQNGYDGAERDRQLSPRQYNLSRSSPAVQEPSPSAVLNGYNADIMNGFPGDGQRYNPVSTRATCVACKLLMKYVGEQSPAAEFHAA